MTQKVLIAWTTNLDDSGQPIGLPQGFSPGKQALPSGFSGSVLVDATVDEQHMQSAQITEHQVETGVNVTDHIRPLPEKLALTGIITNHTLALPDSPQGDGITGSVRALSANVAGRTINYEAFQFDTPFDRVKAVYGDLVAGIQAGSIFSVVTTLRQYSNLAVLSFSGRRDVSAGNSFPFSINFQTLRFVSSQEVDALDPLIQPTKKKKNRGNKSGEQVDPDAPKPAKSTTVEYDAAKKLFAAFGGSL